MMSLTVLSLPQRYKRLLQAMSLAVAVVYMTLLLYQSAYGYPGMQVSSELPTVSQGCQRDRERDLCVGAPPQIVNCHTQAASLCLRSPSALAHCQFACVSPGLSIYAPSLSLSLALLACLAPSFYVSCTFINQRWRRLQLRMRPAPASFQSPSLPLSLTA